MAENEKPPEDRPSETPAITVEPEPIAAEPKAKPAPSPKRPARPVVTLGGIAVLAGIGVGLYLAWPAIMGREAPPAPSPPLPAAETPSPSPPTEAAQPSSPPVEAAQPSPPVEAAQPSSPPVEAAQPSAPVEAPGPSAPSASAPGSLAPEPAPSEAERAALAEVESLKARLAAMEEAAKAREAAPPPTPADQSALATLASRIEALEQRPAEAGAAPASDREAEFAARLAQLEARLVAAEAGAADAASLRTHLAEVQATAGQMTERLAALERRAADDVRLIGLIAAKSALVLAAREGQPLAHELADLRAALTGNAVLAAALDPLDSFAEQGAATFESLRLRFPEIARIAVHAASQPDPDSGWLDQTASRLGSIVTVRKKSGELEPGSLDERLVRAERALNRNDAATAHGALDGVKGGAVIDAFRADLARRLALDEAVKQVERQVGALIVSRVAPGATGTQ